MANGKYGPPGEHLTAAAARGDVRLEMTFEQVGDLVGGLPASARTWRTW